MNKDIEPRAGLSVALDDGGDAQAGFGAVCRPLCTNKEAMSKDQAGGVAELIATVCA